MDRTTNNHSPSTSAPLLPTVIRANADRLTRLQAQFGAGFRQIPVSLHDEDDDAIDPDLFHQVQVSRAFGRNLHVARFARISETPCKDMEIFLNDMVLLLQSQLVKQVREKHAVRVCVCVHAVYEKITKPDAPPIDGYLRTKLQHVLGEYDVSRVVNEIQAAVRAHHVNFMRESSGLRLADVHTIDLYVAKFNPLLHFGSAYTVLPPFLAKKKAIVNVQNKDERCFAYALLSALHPTKTNPARSTVYDKYFTEHPTLTELEYPVRLDQLEEVERKIQIAFNVFTFFDDEGRGRVPAYLSKLQHENEAVDLLFWSGHFAWIKNFSRFCGDQNKNGHTRFYCKRCLGHFVQEHTLLNHQQYCLSVDNCKQVFTMPEEGTKLRFCNVRYQQTLPFVIYADFEALTVPCTDSVTAKKERGIPSHTYQIHRPISVGLKLVSSVPGILDDVPYETHTGEDAPEWLLRQILLYRVRCFEYLFSKKRLVMTEADLQDFAAAVECYVCGKPFPDELADRSSVKQGQRKVMDHDHISGAYRGAAHSRCNLLLRTQYKLPVFLHNFRNYDSHLIVPALTHFKGSKMQVIGQGLEKYLTMTWDDTIVFKDSLQFLSGSLESLVECLKKSGRHNFRQLRAAFLDNSVTDEEGFEMLLRKGVYPYDYMNNAVRFLDDHLPTREQFFSRLANRECSEKDYVHAQQVWAKFGCKTMHDYHNLYLKTDVLLLADVFESFRLATMTTFGLDPAYYVSAPQLSWDCMMKMTGCELTLLSDPAMFTVINDNLRGGISVITKRHAKANNKYMGQNNFNPNERSSYILYLDANNLYGWAMSEPLPYDEFVWMSADECEQVDWRAQADDQPYGYFVECDLDYPDDLHDAHNDYPLAPERLVVEEHLLSGEQVNLRSKYAISHTSTAKLVPNFFPKRKQLLHYRNLRFYLTHGLLLTKVHMAIRFRQTRWLQPYIQTNTELRARSTDAVEVKLRKDMNNSIYGKTCENLTKRSDIRLVNSREICQKLINKSHCRRFQVFTDELAAIELQKIKCLINKPTYVGFAVLELSKLHMYRFHYEQLRVWYPDAELLFTDTDSLVYQIYTDDLYADMATKREHFDFSNYSPSHPLFSKENRMVLGKMKDESNGEIITEFVGLRPKMYSYTTLFSAADDNRQTHLKESKRAKGIQRSAANALTHADYLAQLHQPVENYVNIRRIGQKHHRVYTLDSSKRGLCAFDDKRYLLPDGVHTLAHGHVRLRKQQQAAEPDEEEDIVVVMRSGGAHISPPPVLCDIGVGDEQLRSTDFIALSARQASARYHHTIDDRRELLDAIAGVDLRSTLTKASTAQAFAQTVAPMSWSASCPMKRKRSRMNDDYGVPVETDDDEQLHLMQLAVRSTVSNMF